MKRHNFFMEPEIIDRLKREYRTAGFSTYSEYLRHIVKQFFDRKDKNVGRTKR
jgi:hypothetical protein